MVEVCGAVGSRSTKGAKKEARDFDEDFEQAKHVSEDGWIGIPASSFRAAAISACRLVGFKMTLGKLSVFVEADGYDKVDGTPLVKLLAKEPEQNIMHARIQNTCNIVVRPLWRKWKANVRVTFDEDQFSVTDVMNLFMRVGMQVGIGEGRPDSKSSVGLGWGTFKVTN